MLLYKHILPSLLLLATISYLGAKDDLADEATAVPPPLGPPPVLLNASTPAIKIVQRYPLPNPEEVAVDPTETFFLSGTKDGYVYKTDLESGTIKTIFTPGDFCPEEFENKSLDEVRAFCNGSDLTKEITCGRVLGIKFQVSKENGNCEKVWIANAYFGIYEGSCDAPWTLEKRASGEGTFYNDIEPHGDYLYYTITHKHKTRNQLPYVVLDDTMPGGSFHRLDTTTYKTELLVDGLYFVNGLTSSSDGNSIYVAETTAMRISRYNIVSGHLEPFLDNLEVCPDNIVLTKDGQLLVPGYTRSAVVEALLSDLSALNEFLKQPPAEVWAQFQPMMAAQGNLLVYKEATRTLEERIFVRGPAEGFILASSAHKLGNGDYLVGSVFAPVATRFRVDTAKLEAAEL